MEEWLYKFFISVATNVPRMFKLSLSLDVVVVVVVYSIGLPANNEPDKGIHSHLFATTKNLSMPSPFLTHSRFVCITRHWRKDQQKGRDVNKNFFPLWAYGNYKYEDEAYGWRLMGTHTHIHFHLLYVISSFAWVTKVVIIPYHLVATKVCTLMYCQAARKSSKDDVHLTNLVNPGLWVVIVVSGERKLSFRGSYYDEGDYNHLYVCLRTALHWILKCSNERIVDEEIWYSPGTVCKVLCSWLST